MTMPHLMNCDHSEDSWCLDCVKRAHDAAEAEITSLQEELANLPNPSYCPSCGNCGEEGCCGIHRCMYPQDRPETLERLQKLEAAIAHEISILEQSTTMSTHWEGCEHHHPRCGMVHRLKEALK